MKSRFETFTYYINTIDLYWHRIAAAEMKAYGLKGSSAIYFTQLMNHSEGITSAELAVLCGRDKADVSRDISRFENAGLAFRAAAGGSNYRAPIRLTEKGYQLAQEIRKKADFAVETVGQELTDAERQVFYQALEKITGRIRLLSDDGIPADI